MMIKARTFLKFTSLIFCVLIGVFLAYLTAELTRSSSDKLIEEAQGLGETSPESVLFWQNAIREKGGKGSYELFGEAYGEFSVNKQHVYAHLFGEALYKEMGTDGIVVCDSNYNFGCYHSFFGWALMANGLDIITELDQACIEAYGEMGLGCQHGIGHGVIAEVGYDNLDQALDACATLNWQGPIGGCTSGVFMEFNFNTMNGFANRELDERGLYYPCTEVADRFTQACYFEQPAWWHSHLNMDYGKVGELCDAITDEDDSIACFWGTGNIIAGADASDLDNISAECDLMPTEDGRYRCTEGATWIVSNQPEFKDVWRELCEPYIDTKYYDRCIKSKDLI